MCVCVLLEACDLKCVLLFESDVSEDVQLAE